MKQLLPLVLLLVSIHSEAQQTIDLYTSTIPNSKPSATKEIELEKDGQFFGYQNVSRPSLKIYLPEAKIATGTAVIICPGGGYGMESFKLEGIQIAEAFLKKGVAAFVLKYRLPSDSIMIDKSIGPLQDAQQAMKIVRQRAAEWHLDAEKIGIMGFSAGGHLASTVGTHFSKSYISNMEGISLRPSFMILIYPVISMKDLLTHKGSRENLLGKSATEEQILNFSNELHVNAKTPPTWLTHTGDDTVVPVENSIRFYQELIRHGVPSEMHLYPKGNHGFVLSFPTEEWMQPLFSWMEKSGINTL
ncbi:alpha/beta hydrolase [Arenibacter sp. TNZ]|jgi:acetyl esterase/lipase|uniref:alpha/beta hydrolase n=1 Tax=Arenibacter TaxID=178469 RepID=UPI000CD403C1|nr:MULTISPECIES: alpha/beta hydrolase [Arenibacter]MCM4173995.1 alpha/beta hydrolase [Arenibacter sp. TNZ]